MNIGERVNTPHGVGTVMVQDYYADTRTGDIKSTGRWGVKHDVYPANKPIGMYKDDVLYYWPEELTREEK